MKKWLATIVMVLVAVTFAVGAEAVSLSWMPQHTLFDPATDTQAPVDIVLDYSDAGMNFGGFLIDMVFDPSVIDIADVSWGYMSPFAVDNFLDPGRPVGTLNLADALFLGFDDPMATTGVVATITFDILSKGNSLLEFAVTSTWLDVSVIPWGAYKAFDSLQVGSVAPVPEPGTLILLGSGLVGVFAARRRSRR